LPSRRSIILCALPLMFGCGSSQQHFGEASLPAIKKQPVAFAMHTFDPDSTPTDMPPLAAGESAQCDSDFLSNAVVRGESRRTDATHATLTVTRVTMTLRLNINIWVPNGAAQHLIEHEQGHRQISEYYYQTADKLAEQIAAPYLGKRIDLSGADLNAESGKMLQQLAAEINDEYTKELNSQPAQLLYDTITDHGRNDVIATDAVDHALKNVIVESPGANDAVR
jgi:hypothetical protein